MSESGDPLRKTEIGKYPGGVTTERPVRARPSPIGNGAATRRTGALMAMTVVLAFVLNGLVNYGLLRQSALRSGPIGPLLVHLDEAAFALLFVAAGALFFGMLAVFPGERGYLFLGVLSLLVSAQLLSEWDEKMLLFGPFPVVPYESLAIKSGIVFLAFSFTHYLLGQSRDRLLRGAAVASGVLWAAAAAASTAGAGERWGLALNVAFVAIVLYGMAVNVLRFGYALRREQDRSELRWIARGFITFILILLPDLGKDIVEYAVGRSIGYRPIWWEQGLEDTFPWAFLVLIAVFGGLFFRRFVRTLERNRQVAEQLQAKNTALEQEADTRRHLDRLLTQLTRTYRASDLEQRIVLEGSRFFEPLTFRLIRYAEADGVIRTVGASLAPSAETELAAAWRRQAGRLEPGEIGFTPQVVWCSAGATKGARLFLTVSSGDGGAVELQERERFALQLMSKYTSLFREYFRLIESRLDEMERRRADEQPWLSKLFMQIAEKERKRLASDLHDEALQELLNIRRLLERSAGAAPLEETERVVLLRGLDNAEFMIRETCSELMPSFLADYGVLRSIAGLAEKTRLRADFALDYRPGAIRARLSDELELTVYRIVQELINNALKHAGAQTVTLEVGQVGETIRISYTDDGKGMEPDALAVLQPNRYGLRGILERVRMSGGTVTLDTRPGEGVRFGCTLPIESPAGREVTNPASAT
ncbi:sensor histidine kinase [Paenibacillus flagellatus]|uniref:histidine kinase n=1 Tax=Paenibacillus flagellatus TaxID=2211139 RepID=A0A2V5KC19_9BACL|nr:ATP-binding protein [Paenibacillus flagellatus]PYI56532.1 hypothetical protein DLM86_06065 [Paenibacillus flagellatus]